MNGVVTAALKQRVLIIVLTLCVLGAGIVGFMKLNIEAYPDPVPPLVDIVTQSTGQSAEEMERYITIPIEVQMAGIPHVTSVRTISLFGLSDVKIQFTYDFTYEQAEQWVINRLSQMPPLPSGVVPQISPESPGRSGPVEGPLRRHGQRPRLAADRHWPCRLRGGNRARHRLLGAGAPREAGRHTQWW